MFEEINNIKTDKKSLKSFGVTIGIILFFITLIFLVNNNPIFKNLAKADITAHVNFALLKEFFLKNRLKVKNISTQKDFLSRLGINKRAEIISKKMKFSEQSNLYLRLKRLTGPSQMGDLFKVILAYKFDNDNFYGFK